MALKIRGQTVAEPARGGVTITDEPIWGENTGRNSKGNMIGDIVDWKKTVEVTWPPLTFGQVSDIIEAITKPKNEPFFKLEYNDTSATSLKEITVYSSNVSRTIASLSTAYRRQTGCTVTFIEK